MSIGGSMCKWLRTIIGLHESEVTKFCSNPKCKADPGDPSLVAAFCMLCDYEEEDGGD